MFVVISNKGMSSLSYVLSVPFVDTVHMAFTAWYMVLHAGIADGVEFKM